MSIYKIKNIEFSLSNKNGSIKSKRDEKIYRKKKSNSMSLDEKNKLKIISKTKDLNKQFKEQIQNLYQEKVLKKINIFKKDNTNRIINTRNNILYGKKRINRCISNKEKENSFYSFRLIKQTNVPQKNNCKLIKIKDNNNSSYINNSNLSQKLPIYNSRITKKIQNVKKIKHI